MNPATEEETAPPVHLPVVPTGRLEAVRHAMQDTTTEATPEPPTITVAAEPSASAATSIDAPAALAAGVLAIAEPSAAAPATLSERKALESKIIEVIKTIYDPEIPVNIYELGLIYNVDVKEDRTVAVVMTLTAPACPVAGTLPGEVEKKIEAVPDVKSAAVELVWEPSWCREMMSEAAQLQLGLM